MAYDYMAKAEEAETAVENLKAGLERELGLESVAVKDIGEGKYAIVGHDIYISKADSVIVGSLIRELDGSEYGIPGGHYQVFVPSDKGGWRKSGSRERGPGFGDKVWRRNTKHDGLEISFGSKPEELVLKSLKAAGYRWSGKLGLWWSKNTGKARNIIASLRLTKVDDVAA